MFRDLPTEQGNPRARDLDLLETGALLRVIHGEDRAVLDAVEGALPDIARVVDLAAASLTAGGRIVYAGAGTSGRLGVLDASECPPTFGTDPDRVVALIAGGPEAVFTAQEGAEDDREAGAAAVNALEAGPDDLVVGIAASGVTPYVAGALDAARATGAGTAFVTCGEPSVEVDVVVKLATGPEVLAGSTRMKAGTATKLTLNMISTGAMVRTGRVHDNRMVDLRAGSAKLAARARALVMDLAGVGGDEAENWLDRAGGEVKTAVAMARRGLSADEARERLAAAGGFLRTVLEDDA
ncbi:MAG: N-acetylmuramic acid 6-phosphate etherase [Planctomycetota bacterium]